MSFKAKNNFVDCDASDNSVDPIDKLQECLNKWKAGEEKLVNIMDSLPMDNLKNLRKLVSSMLESDIQAVDNFRVQRERLKRGGNIA